MADSGELRLPSSWIILRCAGRDTLRLVESLGEDGFEVWTPVESRTVRVPKSNVKRQVRQAIMPSYVFAKAGELIELLELAAMPVKPRRGEGWGKPAHFGFSVMKRNSGVVTIADRHFTALRSIEARRQVRPIAKVTFAAGADVRVNERGGSFAGLVGRVQRSDQAITLLMFGKMPVKVPTCVLSLDGIPASLPGTSK